MSIKRVYLASPLGFAQSTASYMVDVVESLSSIVQVINPWDDQRFTADFEKLDKEDSWAVRISRLAVINTELGRSNTQSIDQVDGLMAILDGVDVDSGTASEIGYAFARGKRVYGLRTDFRLAGDNHGSIVNLQVQYFIEASGGRIVTDLSELVDCARSFAAE